MGSAAAAQDVCDGAPSRRSCAAGPARAPRSPPTRSPAIRAALCGDAITAAGARRWNDANVLALSLRAVGEGVLGEILDAWFATAPSSEADDVANVEHVRALEADSEIAPARGRRAAPWRAAA